MEQTNGRKKKDKALCVWTTALWLGEAFPDSDFL